MEGKIKGLPAARRFVDDFQLDMRMALSRNASLRTIFMFSANGLLYGLLMMSGIERDFSPLAAIHAQGLTELIRNKTAGLIPVGNQGVTSNALAKAW